MISQEEIAKKLRIKRSTVGVHILNLQKKGLIAGRGYILNEEGYVLGVGSSNVDIYGKTVNPIRPHYDHPSNITTNVGGVTHNILENLVHLGVKSKFITAVGDDIYGKIILDESEEVGIDTSNSLRVDHCSSGIFMQVLDDNNDMYLALTDFSAIQKMDKQFLLEKSRIINHSEVVVCDPAMPIESLEVLLNNNEHVFLDPTSEALAAKVKDIAHKFYFIKPNLKELAALTGCELNDIEDVKNACRQLIDKGTSVICVSLGKDGCLYMDNTDRIILRKLKPVENMVNASGAGDSFMAAYIYCHVNNMPIEETIDYALAAGIAAITCQSTINEQLSISLLDKILKENKI